jgi:diphosphomevalonate decarboxylase
MSSAVAGSGKATAGANIALVKYWGKRSGNQPDLNLPATSSLSITLDALRTTTQVEWAPDASSDSLILNGTPMPADGITTVLDAIRKKSDQLNQYCRVTSENNFPTAAGLASSASGYCALVLAGCQAFGLSLSSDELSRLCRQGSGSAPRSLFGGFVLMHRGERADGYDAVASPLMSPEEWPFEVLIAITDAGEKSVSSRLGMNHTMKSSPYYAEWVRHNEARLEESKEVVLRKDFDRLSELSEASALQMHASAMAAEPGILYWHPATVACVQAIRHLREQEGVGVFFTIDAGPQVKAVCLPSHSERVLAVLEQIPGVWKVIRSGLGAGARTL